LMTQRTQSVICPQPTRTREDDKTVEIFLHAYRDGQFTHHVNWLAQNQTNVEVIATAEDGTKIAIGHTRLFEFPIGRQGGSPDDDTLVVDVISYLHSTVRFPVKDRFFSLGVDPRNLKKLLSKRYRSRTLGALEEWARKVLPSLQEDSEFVIPIHVQLPLAERTVRMSVRVWGDKGESDYPINVGGFYASYKPDLVSLVRKALKDKLPKLRRSEADRRILMLEIVTLDRDSRF
jgi:hypothetical protein